MVASCEGQIEATEYLEQQATPDCSMMKPKGIIKEEMINGQGPRNTGYREVFVRPVSLAWPESRTPEVPPLRIS
ncbi:hypothetical protein VTK73DRAFT_1621 [Phialemonium thermophilum]|uniref:Uncharacterized protein n=1 Tax=Phialemonium thermophilum TaxID=223376 RepID=A0ABR3X8N1_9PEZI